MGELLFPFLLGVLMNAYDDLTDGGFDVPSQWVSMLGYACAGVACITFYSQPQLCLYFSAVAAGCYLSDRVLARWRASETRDEEMRVRSAASMMCMRASVSTTHSAQTVANPEEAEVVMGEPLWHFLACVCFVGSVVYIGAKGAKAFEPIFGKYPLVGMINLLIGPMGVLIEPAAFPEEVSWGKFEIRGAIGLGWMLGLTWGMRWVRKAGLERMAGAAAIGAGYSICSAARQYGQLTGQLDAWLAKEEHRKHASSCPRKQMTAKIVRPQKEAGVNSVGTPPVSTRQDDSSDETGSDVHSEKLLEQ